jgi:hypothetical protein
VSANTLENVYANMLTHVHKVNTWWLAHFIKGGEVGEEVLFLHWLDAGPEMTGLGGGASGQL